MNVLVVLIQRFRAFLLLTVNNFIVNNAAKPHINGMLEENLDYCRGT